MPSLSSVALVLLITICLVNYPAANCNWQVFKNVFNSPAGETLIQRFFNDVYDKMKLYFWRLWEFLPDRPESLYVCPEWAVINLVDEPQSVHIRENDIKEIKEYFDSMNENNIDNRLPVLHILGLPGSGKTELARQFGKSVYCKKHGASTIVTLDFGSQQEIRDRLVDAIVEIGNINNHDHWIHSERDIAKLMKCLRKLLVKRSDWLLIIDNIRDPSITQKDAFKELPKPGTSDWGIGKMVVATQVPLAKSNGMYVRIRNFDGMSEQDAISFFLKLIKDISNCSCDADVAKQIVGNLSYLPLSIVAASDYITDRIDGDSYSCRDYLLEFAAFDIHPAHTADESELTTYKHSMLTALNLTITNTRKTYSDIFRDFIALIGFAAASGKTIQTKYVQEFCKVSGHDSKKCYKTIFKFPLVDHLKKENLFRVHQATGYAFRKELERTETEESLTSLLQNISHYLANRENIFKDSKVALDLYMHYADLILNLPRQCSHIYCLTSPESQYFNATLIYIIKCPLWRHILEQSGNVTKCLSWVNTFFQVDSPNRTAVRLRFLGHKMSIYCLRIFGGKPQTIIEKNLQLIKEVAPEQPELHKLPLAVLLLGLQELYPMQMLSFHIVFSVFFANYLKNPKDPSMNYHKLCLSLCKITKILAPENTKLVTIFCNPDVIRIYFVPLGRYYNKYPSPITNPYGACYVPENLQKFSNVYDVTNKMWGILSIFSRHKLQFYIDYDKRVGLNNVKIWSQKYEAVLRFLSWAVETQVETIQENSKMSCQSIDNLLQIFDERPTSSRLTKRVIMQNEIQRFIKTFRQKCFLEGCRDLRDVQLHKSKWADLGTDSLIDRTLRTGRLHMQEQTRETEQLFKEIIETIVLNLKAPHDLVDPFEFPFSWFDFTLNVGIDVKTRKLESGPMANNRQARLSDYLSNLKPINARRRRRRRQLSKSK